MKEKQTGLGRGLDALFSDNAREEGDSRLKTLRVAMIEPKSDQPRKTFDEEALAQLASSISTHGLLQPILVRPLPNDRYQIVAGERRWRACKMAGLDEIPALIVDEDEAEAAEISLIELETKCLSVVPVRGWALSPRSRSHSAAWRIHRL